MLLFVLLLLVLLTLRQPTPGAVLAQGVDVPATVTALVQTREAIHALLTATANPQAVAATPQPASTAPTVRIIASGLNVRSGPGTNFGRVAGAAAGETYPIIGRTADCGWLKIGSNGQELGWISGRAQYVTFTAACTSIPLAR